MLRENSRVRVHFYDFNTGVEYKTNVSGVEFVVHKGPGGLGIDYNTDARYGEQFMPFSKFATTVRFENVETGKLYYYSATDGRLKEYVV